MRKIKSKTFHRHLRKREKKEQERILREGGGEEEKDEDEAAKAAIKRRAEDRATLKHSSAGSKWSQKVGFIR